MLDPKSKLYLEVMTAQDSVLRGQLVRRMIFVFIGKSGVKPALGIGLKTHPKTLKEYSMGLARTPILLLPRGLTIR